jgi:hypothetical protein
VSAPKAITVIGFQAKLEGSYNGGGTTSSTTDGIQLAEFMDIQPGYANDGTRVAPPGTTGTQRRAQPTGRFFKGTAKVEPRPFGAAYSASNVPSFHNLLRAAGFDAVVTVTGGAEKWDYTPTPGPTSYGSLVADYFARGEQYHGTGIYSDFNFGFQKAGDVPLFEFPMMGLLGAAITDAAVPAITYPNNANQDPPIASSIVFAFGLLTAPKIRKIAFKMQRKIQDRLDANGTSHGGFGPEHRIPVMEVTLESLPLTTTPFLATAGMDPYALFESANENALSFQFGSAQYKRIKISCPKAQIMGEPKLDKEAQAALWTLSLQLNPSALNANDEIKITTD